MRRDSSERRAPRAPTVISLYTGAGGLDFGLEAAGFRTRVAVEFDRHCCNTLRKNRPTWKIIEGSIFTVTTKALLEAAQLKARGVDLVAGGPPCQPFSKAGNWVRRNGRALGLKDTRARTLSAFMRVVEEVRPKVLLLENVEGFTDGGKNSGLQFILDRLTEINCRYGTRYRAVTSLLNAADFGVPQSRMRRFVIAARSGKEFVFPEPTHGDGRERPITAWDALGDENPTEKGLELKGKWAELLPSIPEGQNYLWHTEKGKGLPLFGWRTRYWTFLLKLAKNRPSWTIQAYPGPSAGPFHWTNRKLSIEEMCRLQTFPYAVEITGPRGPAHRQVGNAVPSLLAEVLGREIRRQLLGQRPRRHPTLLPERRGLVPHPEPTVEVPAQYLSDVGDHPAHPGTGLGPGAVKRERTRRRKAGLTKRRAA